MSSLPKLIGIGHKARRGKDTVAQVLKDFYGYAVLHFADALYGECRRAHITVAKRNHEMEDHELYLINGVSVEDLGETLADGTGMDEHTRFIARSKRQRALYFRMDEWMAERGGLQRGEADPDWAWFTFGGMTEKDAPLLQWWGTEYRRAFYGDDYWIRRLEEAWRQRQAAGETHFVVSDVRFPNEAAWIRAHGGVLWKVDRAEPLEATGRPADHPSETALDGFDWDRVISNEGAERDLMNAVVAAL